jgi:hypothetical protein
LLFFLYLLVIIYILFHLPFFRYYVDHECSTDVSLLGYLSCVNFNVTHCMINSSISHSKAPVRSNTMEPMKWKTVSKASHSQLLRTGLLIHC